jgi:hypothetical protein
MKKEQKEQLSQIIKEAMQKAVYNRKDNIYSTDYFFKRTKGNFRILFAKSNDIFAKRIKRSAIKYLILDSNDISIGGYSNELLQKVSS